MGPSAAMMAAAGIQSLATIGSGFAANHAAAQEAAAMEQQAKLIQQEALLNAQQKAREVTKFQAKQSHMYASSGVTMQGSPALVLEETRQMGQQEVDAMMSRGAAQANLARQKALQTRNAGRAKLFGSFMSAGSNLLQSKYNLGVLNSLNGKTPKVPKIPGGKATPLGPTFDISTNPFQPLQDF